jgi:hypothetical protein
MVLKNNIGTLKGKFQSDLNVIPDGEKALFLQCAK